MIGAYEASVVGVNFDRIAGELAEGMRLTREDMEGRTLSEIVDRVVDGTKNGDRGPVDF